MREVLPMSLILRHKKGIIFKATGLKLKYLKSESCHVDILGWKCHINIPGK
jgi:hypothetical protein